MIKNLGRKIGLGLVGVLLGAGLVSGVKAKDTYDGTRLATEAAKVQALKTGNKNAYLGAMGYQAMLDVMEKADDRRDAEAKEEDALKREAELKRLLIEQNRQLQELRNQLGQNNSGDIYGQKSGGEIKHDKYGLAVFVCQTWDDVNGDKKFQDREFVGINGPFEKEGNISIYWLNDSKKDYYIETQLYGPEGKQVWADPNCRKKFCNTDVLSMGTAKIFPEDIRNFFKRVFMTNGSGRYVVVSKIYQSDNPTEEPLGIRITKFEVR